MQKNQIYELLKVEAEKTIKHLEKLKNGLKKDFDNSPDRESKEEVILRKYGLIFLQQRINKLMEKAQFAEFQRWTKVEAAIRSALDSNDIGSFIFDDFYLKYGFD